jgi:hypothetical protein
MMTHACAAALIVDDFEVDVNDLREDFKIENKQYVLSDRGHDVAPLTRKQD